MRRAFGLLAVLVLIAGLYLFAGFSGWLGHLESPGGVVAQARPDASVADESRAQESAARAIGAPPGDEILFGDLHVHTTFSVDAFLTSLPIMQGEGARPPADACDFARYCSALDFYSINDHAEGLSPDKWGEIKESIRQCNAVAGDAEAPDLVAFLGWEWTQMSASPKTHYGHKNVVLKEIDEAQTPTRPIAAGGTAFRAMRSSAGNVPLLLGAMRDFPHRQRYLDFITFRHVISEIPICPEGVAVRDLPADCTEVATTPRELFDKLDDWGFASIVIPHGNAWGNTTPPGVDWQRQLADNQHDPNRQTLVEVYSGHGNSEVYRPWRHLELAEDGELGCPEPSQGFTPECYRAGEIIRERCLGAGLSPAQCETRATAARRNYIAAKRAGPMTVPGETAEDWLDAGQCSDCFQPAFAYRPGGSSQYALTAKGGGEPGERFRFGFIASSDNHLARPATGYKEFRVLGMTDALSAAGAQEMRGLVPIGREPRPQSQKIDVDDVPMLPGGDERLNSFFYTGGLVAVHAKGRDREAIWSALQRKEVYGTSGPRILLWFDLLNPPGPSILPMGSEIAMADAPRFRVRAVGSPVQRPGCPDYALAGLSPERLADLCLGECYNPGDERRAIERIDVVRLQPRVTTDEDVTLLVEDPWRSFSCPRDPSGCVVEFEDRDFEDAGRDAVYYARVVEEPTAHVNGDPLRCQRDSDGTCLATRPCRTGGVGEQADECLDPVGSHAWSSPIFVDWKPRPPAKGLRRIVERRAATARDRGLALQSRIEP